MPLKSIEFKSRNKTHTINLNGCQEKESPEVHKRSMLLDLHLNRRDQNTNPNFIIRKKTSVLMYLTTEVSLQAAPGP